MWETIKAKLVDDIHRWWLWWTTWLNFIGSSLIAWALSHEGVVSTLIPVMPPAWRPYAPLLALAWGILVQLLRSIKQKKPGDA